LALVSLLTAAVALTWLVTKIFIPLGLAAVTVTIAIALILTPLLAALIRLISSTALLTLSAICICHWKLPCWLPVTGQRIRHSYTPLMSYVKTTQQARVREPKDSARAQLTIDGSIASSLDVNCRVADPCGGGYSHCSVLDGRCDCE